MLHIRNPNNLLDIPHINLRLEFTRFFVDLNSNDIIFLYLKIHPRVISRKGNDDRFNPD